MPAPATALDLQPSRAERELIDLDAELERNIQQQIGEWRFRLGFDVLISFQQARTAADQQRGQIQTRVAVAFAHTASPKNHRMIEQRSVAIRRVPQLLEELSEERNMVGIEF